MTAAAVRKLALSLEGAEERPHFERAAFRTTKRIFATLAGDGGDLNFLFDLVTQARFTDEAPDVFSPVPGGWGGMGATRCDLRRVSPALLREAMEAAHARALPKPKAATKPTKAATKPTKAATEPAKAATKPAKAATKPTKAATKPTQAATKPTKAGSQPGAKPRRSPS